MTHKDKYKIAGYLEKHGNTLAKNLPKRFKVTDLQTCEYFAVRSRSDPKNPMLVMEDQHIDAFRAEWKRRVIERRDWVEPIVCMLSLVCSIIALVVSFSR